ncbi:MAG: rhodanese-like domain-containing protein [Candidatus Kapaibacterium sp.]
MKHTRLIRRGALLLGLALPLPACSQEQSWQMVETMIENDFPEVQQITTDSLARWLADSTLPQPLILDARQPGEYAVSHLWDAHQIDPDATTFPDLDTLDRDQPIVAYCSVGYRSSQLAERLEKAGFTNVVNLQGSIFRWANEGKPVYREDQQVEEVHPYDRLWGTLLDAKLRQYKVEEK